jgi:hypothetical protein
VPSAGSWQQRRGIEDDRTDPPPPYPYGVPAVPANASSKPIGTRSEVARAKDLWPSVSQSARRLLIFYRAGAISDITQEIGDLLDFGLVHAGIVLLTRPDLLGGR